MAPPRTALSDEKTHKSIKESNKINQKKKKNKKKFN
jgi:hypothetical protein